MIYLLRHGQTNWNLEHKIQGHLDIPLNEKGRKDALICAKRLTSLQIDRIISSDLSRARETADIINEFLSLPIDVDVRLREINFGDLQGRKAPDMPEEIWDIYNHNPHEVHAESLADFYKRVKSFWDEVDISQNILIITHGGVIKMSMYLASYPNSFNQAEFEKIILPIKIKNTEIFSWDKIHPIQPLVK